MKNETKFIAHNLRSFIKRQLMEQEVNGYIFKDACGHYEIYKPTDIEKEPQFKGEPLLKTVPGEVDPSFIEQILDHQLWIYL